MNQPGITTGDLYEDPTGESTNSSLGVQRISSQLRVVSATPADMKRMAELMATVASPWSDTYPFSGSPASCLRMLVRENSDVVVVKDGEKPLASFLLGDLFLGRPAVRIPVFHEAPSNGQQIADYIRAAVKEGLKRAVAKNPDEKNQVIYVTLPTGPGKKENPNLIDAYFPEIKLSLGDPPAGDPELAIIKDRVTNYLAEGQDEVLFRLNGRGPRNDNSNPYYAPPRLKEKKEKLKVDITVNNPRDPRLSQIMWELANGMAASEPWLHYGYLVKECKEKLSVPGSLIFIATAGGSPVGFALFDPRGFLDLPEIGYLWVREDCRGRGVGTRLMDEVVKFMEENSMGSRLYLAVSEPNTEAQKLYSRYGFILVTSISNYNVSNESELVMVKFIRPGLELPAHFEVEDQEP